MHKKVTSSIEISGKKLYDDQKKQNDGETAHILIHIWGNPMYHYGKELTSDYTLTYGTFWMDQAVDIKENCISSSS